MSVGLQEKVPSTPRSCSTLCGGSGVGRFSGVRRALPGSHKSRDSQTANLLLEPRVPE